MSPAHSQPRAPRRAALALWSAVALIACLLPVACEPAHPAAHRFEAPPYTLIADGIRPPFDKPPAEVPSAAPGEKVVFFAAADGAVTQVVCDKQLFIEPAVPQTFAAISRQAGRGAVALAVESAELHAQQRGRGELQLAQTEGQIASAAGKGGMESAVGAGEIAKTTKEGGIKTESGERTVAEATGTGGIMPEQVAVAAPTTRGAGAEKSVSETAVGKSVERTHGTGSVFDQPFVDILTDSSSVSGFYDQDNHLILDETSAVIAMEEQEQLIALLRNGGKLSELMDRPPSAAYRRDAKLPSPANYEGKVELATAAKEVYYGHAIALTINVKNVGTAPLFDTVVLNGLPAHTKFVRFALPEGKPKGFFPYHLQAAKQDTIFVKVYRPIQPGQSFRITMVLRADPWPMN